MENFWIGVSFVGDVFIMFRLYLGMLIRFCLLWIWWWWVWWSKNEKKDLIMELLDYVKRIDNIFLIFGRRKWRLLR